jgi:hypothetical protein
MCNKVLETLVWINEMKPSTLGIKSLSPIIF